ncbi:MAG: catalase [Actinomycetota bacterium]
MTDAAKYPDQPLTNRQGHKVYDNQNTRTIGARGPATLENYQFLEKISHFDRERVPERVVHARGTTAFGYFEAYGKWGDQPIANFTRAKLFQEASKRSDVAIRFSTVAGGRDSSEVARDPRGFAVKIYTEDGNWDLVGNNLGVFFIRDALKFPDFIHSQKPDPVNFQASVPNRAMDFFSQSPESMHMVMLVFSPRGIPADYRHMQGFGVNTYKWVNAAGETVLVKYHWLPKQGVKSLTAADAANVQAHTLGSHTKDLHDAIEAGNFPEWELQVQMMSDDEHPELDFDPLDDTKVWPEEQFPPQAVGRIVLDRNAQNFFAESEQIAFGTGVLVDGLDFSDDKMLVGRTFSYSDTQRHRVGPNYLQLPVNSPKAPVATNQRDGQMAYIVDTAPGQNLHVNYEPSITGGVQEAAKDEGYHHAFGPEISGRLTRERIERTNDYLQAGQRFYLQQDWEREDLITNLTDALSQSDRPVQERMLWHLYMIADELGERVGNGIGITLDEVKDLGPLASQNLSEAEQAWMANMGKNGPRDVSGLTMTHCVPNERVKVDR